MIITCKKCNTSFNLDESLLKQTGSRVQCSKCNNIFIVYPTEFKYKSDKSTALRVRDDFKAKKTQALRISKAEEEQAKQQKRAL